MKSSPSPTSLFGFARWGVFVKLNASSAELQLDAGSHGELACQPEVPVEETRPAQVVVAGVAEARFGYLGKRCRIVVGRAPADSAELLHVRLHLVRRLDAARQVERGVVREHTERCAAHDADHVVDLPPADDVRQDAPLTRPVAAGAERQLPDVRDAQVVRPISAGARVVALEVRQRLGLVLAEGQGAVLVVAHRLAPRVVHAQAQTTGEPPLQLRLQGVVAPFPDRLQKHGGRGAAVAGLQGLALVSSADDLSGIDVEQPELPRRLRPDIADLPRETPRQLSLHRHVPRLDVAAVQVLRIPRPRVVARDVEHAVTRIGQLERGNPLRQRSRRRQPIGGLELHLRQNRVVRPNQLHAVVGIVGEAVTRAGHPFLPEPIRQPHTRAEARLARIDAAVLRHGADATEPHLVGRDVVAFDSPVGSCGNGEVLHRVPTSRVRLFPTVQRSRAYRLYSRARTWYSSGACSVLPARLACPIRKAATVL